MDQLAAQQTRLAAEIEAVITNYKKDSTARKQKAEYFEERLRRIEASWDIFEETDSKIRALKDVSRTHDYFLSQLYETTQSNFQKFQAHFKEKLLALRHADDNIYSEASGPSQADAPKTFEASSKLTQDTYEEILKLIRRHKALAESLRRLFDRLDVFEQPATFYKLKIESINQYWTQLEDYHQKIWGLTDDPMALGYDLNQHIKLEEITQDWVIRLEIKHEELKATSAPAVSAYSSPKVNLPKITLPKFDGDYLQWRQFHDLFVQMVHNQVMSNCQKMWYLKANLTGDADKLLRNFALSDDNYESAWKTLNDRYDNRRLLVAALINKLLGQPSCANDKPSAAAVRSLHDTTQECIRGLENIDVITEGWDPLLLHILIKKLDTTTHSLYEQSLLNPRTPQPIKEFLAFLEMRFQALEALSNKTKGFEEARKKFSRSTAAAVTTSSCFICNQTHPIYYCPEFLKHTPSKRLKIVQTKGVCVNCFKEGHKAVACSSRGCKECSRKHNSLLHLSSEGKSKQKLDIPKSVNEPRPEGKQYQDTPTLSLTTLHDRRTSGYILLSTAIVKLIASNGKSTECRAILDPGSQVNLITERIVKKLGLPSLSHFTFIEKVGGTTQRAQKRVNIALKSRLNAYTTHLEAYVLDKIISPQPSLELNIAQWPIPQNLKLADPNFHHTERIDLLLSAEHFYDLLSIGQIRLGSNLPVLQNTLLGWIVAGKVVTDQTSVAACGVLTTDQRLNNTIERFWRLEEATENKPQYTSAERACETHFCQTTQRAQEGRFLVRLPFNDDPGRLGESKDIAKRRFFALERRLQQNPELKRHYEEFINEYINLGHMQEVALQSFEGSHYFLPHHCVLKPESSTTKLRVVFDASCKTSTNVSLNDILHTGPTIQDDLFAILLRFRLPRYVFTADIQKMYRQILLHKDDRKYQLLIWRNELNQPLRYYQLNTVTYGTTSAPYLATKCLQRLAQEEIQRYPLGANVLLQDFYVDDVMTGSNTLAEAVQAQIELIKILESAGMKLHKWCASHPRLLHNIASNDKEVQLDFSSHTEDFIKTLGLTWLPKVDDFQIRINIATKSTKITKRTVSSDIARMFDPLGIMGPVIVTAKLFLQEIWRLDLDWDAALPEEMYTRWFNFRKSLQTLEKVPFPRHIFAKEKPKQIQLHVFCDASEKAYGAAVYVRSTLIDGGVIVRLLCAKSRLAPIRPITIPRLELCAAKLGAELAQRSKSALKMEEVRHTFWSDSEIVLGWINSTASAFNTFVANRVSSIQSLSMPKQWRHVDSRNNPADILSRGIAPAALARCHVWLHGPPFLHGAEDLWPPEYTRRQPCDLEERKKLTTLTTVMKAGNFIDDIQHGNSFKRLQRVTAYMLRFTERITGESRPSASLGNSLTSRELSKALEVIVKFIQRDEFSNEIQDLAHLRQPHKGSPIFDLTPFLDESGILRVGGRLAASNLSFDAKHPMLLPYNHPLTKLLMTDIHHDNCHFGPQALLATTRQRFWPVKGKTLARSIVRQCVRCNRANPQLLSQLMGNLPSTRVQPARPFINAGVDFCGPMMIHYRGRGTRPQKGYIAIFCCFATKAVHLELVSDLSTEAFIGSLKRFIGRRGHCRNLYCDNATNFVRAHNQLKELSTSLYSGKAQGIITDVCNARSIDFHFIPPRAPHFGGLWEAAVKSAKYLLLRGASAALLTYEELQTLVVEIEAILNSRPLTPLPSDPNDLTALTPGHFLIGEPPTAAVDTMAEPLKGGLLTRWNLVRHVKQEFWRRWSKEYLNHLQHRSKWKQSSQNIQPGLVVIIKEDNSPVMKWPLGRVVKVYKGEDGYVRVADVKTASGILKRPIIRLAPLPVEEGAVVDDDEIELRKRSCLRKDSEADNSRNQPKKRMKGASLISMLLACLMVPLIKTEQIRTTSFGSNPGLHFQSLGQAHLSSSEWKLLIYYDLRPYWAEFAILRNGTEILQQLCDQGNYKAGCLQLKTHFSHMQGELSTINKLFKPRSRRGALNIVGSMAKSLFGVLDEEYANQMSHTINAVKGNQNKLFSLLKNQTSVIDSTLNIIGKNEQAVQTRFMAIETELDRLANAVKSPNSESSKDKVTNLIMTLSFQMTLITFNLQRIQASIINVVTDTQHGKFNPLLLSQQQLSEEIANIKEHLPEAQRLPIIRENALQLFKVASFDAKITKDFVIFELQIPLVNIATFDFFELFPIPTLQHDRLMAILPSYRYLIVSPHRDVYYPLTEPEYRSCTWMEPASYICKQSHPLYHQAANISTCEIMLLKDMPPSTECSLTEIHGPSLWIQLSHSNQWIFALKTRVILHIVCNGNSSTMSLEGSGILEMEPECILKSDTATIQGHRTYFSKFGTSYTKIHLGTEDNSLKVEALNKTSSHYLTYAAEINALKTQLRSQDFSNSNELDVHDIHHYTVGYISLGLFAAFAAFLTFKLKNLLCRSRPRRPVPRPRCHSLPTTQEF